MAAPSVPLFALFLCTGTQWVLEAVYEIRTWFCYIFGSRSGGLCGLKGSFNRVASRALSISPASQHREQVVGKCPKTCTGLWSQHSK